MSKPEIIDLADLFCGAGGTTSGAVEACRALGLRPRVTAVNHWPVAIKTHSANHPDARHVCASLDSVNPRHLYREGKLNGLLASPECMGHSIARGGRPINDQSRATAWCVLRWMDALRPDFGIFENVPEFEWWAPIGSNGRPLKSRRGEVFQSWIGALRSLGYNIGYRKFVAADYGDPTTRCRLIIQAVRGRRKIVWPDPTHAPTADPGLFGALRPYTPARAIIDWSLKGESIFRRKRPLVPNTLRRIYEGVRRFWRPEFADALAPFLVHFRGTSDRQIAAAAQSVDEPLPAVTAQGNHFGLVQPFVVAMEHGGRVLPADAPLPTVTCAKGGAFGVVEPFLIQTNHSGDDASRVRKLGQPLPTVCGNRGEWAVCEPFIVPNFGERDGQAPRTHSVGAPLPTVTGAGAGCLVEPLVIKFYGTGVAQTTDKPLDTVTTKDRFGLALPSVEIRGERSWLDVLFRMLQPRELAAAQGFPASYQFSGNKTEITRQIGNAVPRRLARALVAAVVSQRSDVSWLQDETEAAA